MGPVTKIQGLATVTIGAPSKGKGRPGGKNAGYAGKNAGRPGGKNMGHPSGKNTGRPNKNTGAPGKNYTGNIKKRKNRENKVR